MNKPNRDQNNPFTIFDKGLFPVLQTNINPFKYANGRNINCPAKNTPNSKSAIGK